MGKTGFATDNALTKKAFDEKLYRDSKKESYFSRFTGKSTESIVQEKTDLEGKRGDEVTFGIRMRLAGAGVEDGTILEGNEERLVTYETTLALKQYRHAVRDDGAMTRQRAMFSIDDESKMALKDWGSEKQDDLCFDAIQTTPTKVFYRDAVAGAVSAGSAATAIANLSATNSKLTPNFISAIRTWAESGGNRQYVPIRPVKVDGETFYVLLTHNDVLYDLVVDSTYQAAQREARDRGKDNPLFKGAVGVWDGVVVHKHENINVASTGGAGANVPYATCAFMGAQALMWAWGKRPKVVEKDFDYENEHGYAWEIIARTKKPQFNSLDYGSLGVYVARTAISSL
jgi:N4-gp56 family major capsid protein